MAFVRHQNSTFSMLHVHFHYVLKLYALSMNLTSKMLLVKNVKEFNFYCGSYNHIICSLPHLVISID